MKNIIEIILLNTVFSYSNGSSIDISYYTTNYLLNICFNFIYFIEKKSIKYQDYIDYIGQYKDIYLFNPLPQDIFDILTDKINIINFELQRKELLEKSFIEIIYEISKNNKQLKHIAKFLDPYIINFRMIKNTKEHYNLCDINSVMLLFSGLGELYLPLLDIKYIEQNID
jgi:hypothetical protein